MRFEPWRGKRGQGMTLMETILVVVILGIASVITMKNMELFKALIFQNIHGSQMAKIHEVNNEIQATVRGAQRILLVSHDRLELIVYNDQFKPQLGALPANWNLDRRWVEQNRKVVYRYDGSQAIPRIIREIYAAANYAVTPLNYSVLLSNKELYKNEYLVAPAPGNEAMFKELFVSMGGRIGGVAIEIRVLSPMFKTIRTPYPVEAVLYGREF